jgi:hypothetical protein
VIYFSLPPLAQCCAPGPGKHKQSRSVSKRLKSHALNWANSGITALNELSGFEISPGSNSYPPQVADVHAYIRDTYLQLPPPAACGVSREGALSELLQSSGAYSDERSDLAPYDKSLVSWPQMGFKLTLTSLRVMANVCFDIMIFMVFPPPCCCSLL